MPDVWMPSTEQVREAYSIDAEDEYRDPINAPANRRANERYFDRWLAAHDREVAARALEAASDTIYADKEGRGIVTWNSFSVAHRLRERAAALRSGTEGSTDA